MICENKYCQQNHSSANEHCRANANVDLCPFNKLYLEEKPKQIRVLESDCTCWGDHNGMATNPKCIIHGDRR